MSDRTEVFKFDLNDRVLIREIQRPGKVIALLIDFVGVQYRIQYWDNATMKTEWLHADELEAR